MTNIGLRVRVGLLVHSSAALVLWLGKCPVPGAVGVEIPGDSESKGPQNTRTAHRHTSNWATMSVPLPLALNVSACLALVAVLAISAVLLSAPDRFPSASQSSVARPTISICIYTIYTASLYVLPYIHTYVHLACALCSFFKSCQLEIIKNNRPSTANICPNKKEAECVWRNFWQICI